MAHEVFYSFHFDFDHWRAAQVRNMGVVAGKEPVSANDWEVVKGRGDASIKQWISGQMNGCDCLIVLTGAETASRPWVRYEIEKGWNDGLGVVGIRIHGLKNSLGNTSLAGANPFDGFEVGGKPLPTIVTLHDPSGTDSQAKYKDIHDSIPGLVEAAIKIRKMY